MEECSKFWYSLTPQITQKYRDDRGNSNSSKELEVMGSWKNVITEIEKCGKKWDETPKTKQIRKMTKIYKKLVVAPVDKERGNMVAVCPMKYWELLEKTFSTVDYKPITENEQTEMDEEFFTLQEKLEWGQPTKNTTKKGGWYEKHEFSQAVVWIKAKNWLPTGKINGWEKMKVRPLIGYSKNRYRKTYTWVAQALTYMAEQLPHSRAVYTMQQVIKKTHKTAIKIEEMQKNGGEVLACARGIGAYYTNVKRGKIIEMVKTEIVKIKERKRCKFICLPQGQITSTSRAKQERRPKDGTNRTSKMIKTWHHPFLSSHAKHTNTMCIALDDIPKIIEWDFKYNYFYLGGALKRQCEGMPMGSPTSSGLAVIYGAIIENNYGHEVEHTIGLPLLNMRWMDDCFCVHDKNESKVMVEANHPCFYGVECSLEEATPTEFVGLRILVDKENGVMVNTQSPNAERILQGIKEMKIKRTTHGAARQSITRKIATLTGGILRTIDCTYGPQNRLVEDLVMLIIEYQKMGYDRKTIGKVLKSLAEQWPGTVLPEINEKYKKTQGDFDCFLPQLTTRYREDEKNMYKQLSIEPEIWKQEFETWPSK